MNMKEHILAALDEQLSRWEMLLGSLSAEQITAPRFDDNWSVQDVVAHLWAWQQVSVARLEAAMAGREPVFPQWTEALPGDWEEDADQTNARIFETYHARSWPVAYQSWREGYVRLVELGEPIAEKDLLDAGRYPWLKGYSLAFVLVASYDHHQEHFEKLVDSLQTPEG